MSLADQYERQARWRHFGAALAHIPITPQARVLDVGCGVGTMTAVLSHAGANAVGLDVNDALLERARALHPRLTFEHADVSTLDADAFGRVDGIWSSFVAAYFPDLDAFVALLRECLRDDGWLALVEVDDMLGHEPRSASLAHDIESFYAHARVTGGYGFNHGRALAPTLVAAGFEIVHTGALPDDELAFDGPAPPDVLDAWRARFARMGGMQAFFGDRFDEVTSGIMDALASPSHRSLCRVMFAVARRGGS